MPVAPGTRLGPYEILAPIGAGGMGEVYHARDITLKRDVALKVLPAAFAKDPERMARFQREAEVLTSLNHPNIAAIYGVEEGALVMELVEGETLAEIIGRGLVPLDTALEYAGQIAAALDAAHEKGIVHRDLKPANVKIKAEGVVKVLDFGLAKAADTLEPAGGDSVNSPTLTISPTRAGMILGTPAYMSPEQARGIAADKRADIWSFGVVLYEMLTGLRLFVGETISDTLAAVLNEEPEFERIPLTMRKLLRLCLAKDPRHRLRDIGDVRALIDAESDQEIGAPSGVRPGGLPPWGWAALGGLAMALVLLATIHFREVPPERVGVRFQIAPPEGGTFTSLALSPDGRRLAFTASIKDTLPRLWVRALDSVEPQALPGTEDATFPFWSPDGRFLAFTAGTKLRKIEAGGSAGFGVPQTLCDVGNIYGGYWSTSGVIYYGTLQDGIFAVSQNGGEPVRVTKLEEAKGEVAHRFPQVLPDGRHYMYLKILKGGNSAVYLSLLDGKETKRLTESSRGFSYAPPRGKGKPASLFFLREDVLLAQTLDPKSFDLAGEAVPVAQGVGFFPRGGALFTVTANGTAAYGSGVGGGSQLVWLDRAGKPLGALAGRAFYSDVALSRDGTRVAVEQFGSQASNGNIWLIDTAQGIPTRFTFADAYDWDPIWSPDGSRVAFSSNRDGQFNLYLKYASGARPEERLGKADVSERPCDWSRDGRSLMFVRSGTGSAKLWVVTDPLGEPATRKSVPYLDTPFNTTECQFSPDSHWVAYTSDESKQGYEIYVQSFPVPLSKFQVSGGGGIQPRWRSDGTELFYVADDGKLMVVEVKMTPTFQAGIPHALFDPHIAVGRGVRFAFRYDVTPDGQRFLVNDVSHAQVPAPEPITIVLNWEGGLKN